MVWGILLIVLKLIEYHWLDKRRIIPAKFRNKLRLSMFILIIIFSLFETYTAFHPLNRFYKNEFKSFTGIDFPKSAKIISSDSWYPDFQGDYWAAAVFEVSSMDNNKILKQLVKNQHFQIDTTKQGIGITSDYGELVKDIDESKIFVIYKHIGVQWFKVAFLDDNKTIIFEKSSSSNYFIK
jgi:hypothetical protein